jgi:hypothetical protein
MNVYAQTAIVSDEELQQRPLYDAHEPLFNELGRRRRIRRQGQDPDMLMYVPPHNSLPKQ